MATGDRTIIAKKSQVDALDLRVGTNEDNISVLNSRTISMVASNSFLGNASLTYTVDYGEATDTTTRDYVVGDLISDGTNKVVVKCIANSTAGELLTNTDYFTVKGTNFLNLSNAVFTYTNGKDNNGYIVTTRTIGDANYSPSSTAEGLQWVYKADDGSLPALTPFQPMNGLYDKEFADDNRLVFNTSNGKLWATKGGELLTSSTDTSSSSNWVAENDASVDVTNGVLSVNANTTDYPIAKSKNLIDLPSGDIVIEVELGGRNPRLVIETGDGKTITNLYSSGKVTISGGRSIKFQCWMNGTEDDETATFKLVSIYKKQATLDTPVATPLSFLPNPIMYVGGVPQYIDKSKTLPSVVVDNMGVENIALKTANGQLPAMLGIGGEGYTWVDEHTNRAFGVTYTNNTGKPITIAVNGIGGNTSSITDILIDGKRVSRGVSRPASTYVTNTATAIVPNSSTYQVIDIYNDQSVQYWFELK